MVTSSPAGRQRLPRYLCSDQTDVEGDCRGDAVPGHAQCLAHLDALDRAAHLAGLSPGDTIAYRGTRFTTELLDVLLSSLRDPATGNARVGQAWFHDATFTRPANFHGAVFTRGAGFRDATFTHEACFDHATFTAPAAFTGVRFTGPARFNKATFIHQAWFHDATFTDVACFEEATFTRDAWFRGTTFTHTPHFTGATFLRKARFDGGVDVATT